MYKTVDYLNLDHALSRCIGPKEAKKMIAVINNIGKLTWPQANTTFIKVNDNLYKVQGRFAKDYLR